MVYARTLGGRTYTFQVSGRLWRNSLIMVDRETDTYWSQVTGRAIGGQHRGAQLEKLEATALITKTLVELGHDHPLAPEEVHKLVAWREDQGLMKPGQAEDLCRLCGVCQTEA